MRPRPAVLVLVLASGVVLAGCRQEAETPASVTSSRSPDADARDEGDPAAQRAGRNGATADAGRPSGAGDAGTHGPEAEAGAADRTASAPDGSRSPAGEVDDEAVAGGRLQATVESVSPTDGAVTLRSTGEPVQLRGTPFQLAGLLPGQQVEVTWRTYGKVRWMMGGEGPGERVFARSGVVRGTVERREVPQGRLVVTTDAGRSTLRGHPEQLGAVVPGQFVEVPFVRVDQTAWLAETPRVVAAGDASGP